MRLHYFYPRQIDEGMFHADVASVCHSIHIALALIPLENYTQCHFCIGLMTKSLAKYMA